MPEEEAKEVHKKKGKEAKSSVKSYKLGIETEKQKMGAYSKKFKTTVRSLQADIKKHTNDIKDAAANMRKEGIKTMSEKIRKFKATIPEQVKENKEAANKIETGVKFLLSEIHKKKKDFRAYLRGPFSDYIKAFWG